MNLIKSLTQRLNISRQLADALWLFVVYTVVLGLVAACSGKPKTYQVWCYSGGQVIVGGMETHAYEFTSEGKLSFLLADGTTHVVIHADCGVAEK